MPIKQCEYPPNAALLLDGTLLTVSLASIFLGHRVKQGDQWALAVATVLLWGLTVLPVANLLLYGSGLYELAIFGSAALFFSFLLLIGSAHTME